MPTLAERLADPSPEVRAQVARDVRDLATYDLELDPDDCEAFGESVCANGAAFVALVADPEPAVRAAACAALGELACATAVADQDGWKVLPALGRLADAAAPRLAEALGDAEAVVRAAAAGALSHVRWSGLDDAAETVALTRALGDPEPAVRGAAAEALVRKLGRRAEARIAPLLPDRAPEVEDRLIASLVEIDSPLAPAILLRRLRTDELAATHEHVRAMHRILLDSSEARAVLVPLLGREVDPERRKLAAHVLIEHADGSCGDALAPLLDGECWRPAALALARLGPEAPADGLLRLLERPEASPDVLFTAGWAAAACERLDCLPPLLRALASSRRGIFGEAGSSRRPIPWWLLATISAFDHPSLHAAAARFVVAPWGPKPPHREHAASWNYAQSIFELGTGCLALGSAGDAAGLPLIRGAIEELAQHEPIGTRTRMCAAIGVALIDPDALDHALAGSDHEPWFPRISTFEHQVVPFAFALRLLGRRLRARAAPLSAPARALVEAAVRFVDTADLAGALRVYRGRDAISSGDAAWVFPIRDLFAAARADLARHCP